MLRNNNRFFKKVNGSTRHKVQGAGCKEWEYFFYLLHIIKINLTNTKINDASILLPDTCSL